MLDYASPVGKSPESPNSDAPLFKDHSLLASIGGGVQFLTDPVPFLLRTGKDVRTVQRFRMARGNSLFLVHRPEHVEIVLQRNPGHFRKASPYSLVKMLFGKGLLFNEGADHLRQKRAMHPSFSPKAVNLLTPSIVTVIQGALEKWQPPAEGRRVNLEVFTQDLARHIIEHSMFGPNPEISIESLLDQDPSKMRMMLGALPISPQRPAFFKARRYLEEGIAQAIQNRRDRHAANPDAPAADILEALVTAKHKDTGEGMPDDQIIDEVITLLFSGFDTSARTLTGCFHALSENPEVKEKFMEEAENTTPEKMLAMGPGAMPYVVRVIRETMRLYPPNPLIGRMALEDTHIGSCPVPAGAFIALSPFLAHRDPDYWPNPDKFDPDRFLASSENDRPKYSYFPFGGGLRQCIGLGLAMTAIPITAVLLARRYNITRLDPKPVEFDIRLTLRTKYPYYVRINDRN